jgi:hypothetical protein
MDHWIREDEADPYPLGLSSGEAVWREWDVGRVK